MNRINRVAIVGMGMVNSQGIGSEGFEESFSKLPQLCALEDTNKSENVSIRFSKVGELDTGKYLPGVSLRCIDRTTIYAGIATSIALNNTIAENKVNPTQIGVSLGTSLGSLASISSFDMKALTEGSNAVNPNEFPNTVSNAPTSKVGIWFKLKGPSITLSNGLTSAIDSVGFAFDEISYGKSLFYLAGGSEELSENIYEGYKSVIKSKKNHKSTSEQTAEVIGEGSGILFLSSLDEALNNNLKVRGEIIDFFSSKISENDEFSETVLNIIRAMLDANKLDKNEVRLYTCDLLYNSYSKDLLDSLTGEFSTKQIKINNIVDTYHMNYLGVNGIYNMMSAIEDMENAEDDKKAAVIFDVGCDGKFSCLVIKK